MAGLMKHFRGAEGRTLHAYKMPTSSRLDLSVDTGSRTFDIELPEESAIKLRDYLNEIYPQV